ncbi:MAG: methyl-accepting chemotaxis protein, partial [Bdellovibrionaceae bacterium]|nr:methyl-accepting chemotaxis protein [Pseudobdellovibrionaceae bacterium]
MNFKGLNAKLVAAFLLIGAVPVMVAMTISISKSEEALKKSSLSQLVAIREAKGFQIEQLFSTMEKQVVTLSSNDFVVEAAKNFSKTFYNYKTDATEQQINEKLLDFYENQFASTYRESNEVMKTSAKSVLDQLSPLEKQLQFDYIANNPNPLGEKHELLSGGPQEWSNHHKKYHPTFKKYLEEFGYYDIFIVEPQSGHIIYSVFKELDFATSLKTGPYKDTNFAKAFNMAAKSRNADDVFVVDLEKYYPSYEAPAGFLSSPIFDNDQLVGVLIFQLPVAKIDEIMTSGKNWRQVGYGESGETYLVGSDYKMRSLSRFLVEDQPGYRQMVTELGMSSETMNYILNKETTTISQVVETAGTKKALAGNIDAEVFDDYRGVSVYSAYRPLNIEGLNWVIMSEIDEAEAQEAVLALQKSLLVELGLAIFIIFGFALVASRRISGPLQALANNLGAAAIDISKSSTDLAD